MRFITEKNNFKFVLLVVILSLPAVWALFVPGFFGVSDDMHIAWLYEMDRVVRAFQFPRFAPDLSFGFGYPLFNFVFPLPFYVGELFHLIGFSLVGSIKTVFLLSIVASMLAMYKLLREYVSDWLSLAGAVVYAYAPYRATDIFVRGAIGEAVSFVFYPLIILSFIKITDIKNEKVNWKWVGIGSLSIAGLILSHNISAYMFIPLALILPLVSLVFSPKKKIIFLNLFYALLFGLLNSIYFWLPALKDSRLVKYDTIFNFIDHFPNIKQLITPFWGYGASVPGPYDGMSFFIGISSLVVIVLGTGIFIYNLKRFSREKRILLFWALGVFIFSFFMMNYRSTFIWKAIPFIAYFQFPWRFLALIVFSSSIFVLSFEKLRYVKIISYLLIAVSIVFGLTYFKPSEFLHRFDDYYLNRYIPYPVASQEYKKIGEEYLRLPLALEVRPDKNYPALFGSGFTLKTFNKPNSLDLIASVEVGKDYTVINYNKYNFPGWTTYLDGKRIDHVSGAPFGQISFTVPKGVHDVKIVFQETPPKKVLDLVSLVSVIFMFCLVFKKQKLVK